MQFGTFAADGKRGCSVLSERMRGGGECCGERTFRPRPESGGYLPRRLRELCGTAKAQPAVCRKVIGDGWGKFSLGSFCRNFRRVAQKKWASRLACITCSPQAQRNGPPVPVSRQIVDLFRGKIILYQLSSIQTFEKPPKTAPHFSGPSVSAGAAERVFSMFSDSSLCQDSLPRLSRELDAHRILPTRHLVPWRAGRLFAAVPTKPACARKPSR